MGETEDERVETPAEASESAKGDLSYHYWHARANAGDATIAERRVTLTHSRTRRVVIDAVGPRSGRGRPEAP